MKNENKNIAVGIAAGAIAGVIAGILLAPKSGKETRKDIDKHLHEIKDNITDELTKVSDLTKDKYGQIVGKVVDIYEKEKKLSVKEAKQIKDTLEENFDEVKRVILKKNN